MSACLALYVIYVLVVVFGRIVYQYQKRKAAAARQLGSDNNAAAINAGQFPIESQFHHSQIHVRPHFHGINGQQSSMR